MSSEKYIDENMGLVGLCIKRFLGRGIEYDDLFQSGCLGLVKAAERFDENLGYRFSSFAVPVILGEIRSLFRNGRQLKASRSSQSLCIKLKQETESFVRQNGRYPSMLEASEIMGISVEHCAELMNLMWGVESIDENEGSRSDIPDKESGVERLTDSISLWQTIESLPDEDKKLIGLRYYMSKTQKETAELLGTSQVQISRREKRILLCMRGEL